MDLSLSCVTVTEFQRLGNLQASVFCLVVLEVESEVEGLPLMAAFLWCHDMAGTPQWREYKVEASFPVLIRH